MTATELQVVVASLALLLEPPLQARRQHATVDRNDGASDPVASGRRQEQRHAGHVGSAADATARNRAFELKRARLRGRVSHTPSSAAIHMMPLVVGATTYSLERGVGQQLRAHLALDEAGSDGVHVDVLVGQVTGKVSGQVMHGRLAGIVRVGRHQLRLDTCVAHGGAFDELSVEGTRGIPSLLDR